MTERKRAGARRKLADAAAPKRASRPIDDAEFPAHPDQTELLPTPPPAVTEEATEAATPASLVKQPHATAQPKPAPPTAASGVKYTAVLDDDTVDAFEGLTRVARRRLGRHVSKLEVLSSLLLLAADDPSLRDQLISGLAQHQTTEGE